MARRKRHEEHESHERWLVSYADFITLLFAFFVVLYATSQADVEKQEQFEKSIKQEFSGFNGFGLGSQFDHKNDPNANSMIPPTLQGFPPMNAGPAEVEDAVIREVEKNMTPEERERMVGGIRHDALGVRIQIAANKLFPSGSAELDPSSVGALDKLGRLLKSSGRKIVVEGHTDDIPIKTEKFPSNWELSASRATKIVRYLSAVHRIPGSHLTAVAYADQRPVAPNSNEVNRAKNRRIEIMIVTSSKAF